MARTFVISAPGYEIDLEVGLRVPTGDTVAWGSIAITKSSSAFNVLNGAVNTVDIEIDGITYGPGQGIVFDLEVPGTVTDPSSEYFDVAYETAGGTKRTDRVYLEIRQAVETVVSPTIQSRLGQSDVTDRLAAAIGISPTASNLGTFTGDTIPDNSSAKTALQALESVLDAATGQLFRPEDYGAVAGFDVSKAQAAINADAIRAAHQAATNAQHYLPNSTLGGSVNRSIMPRVVIDKLFLISKPIEIPHQGGVLNWDCWGGTIARYGDEGGFELDYPGRCGLEIGDILNENTVPMFAYIRGLTITGFARCAQLGYGPANMNMSMWSFDHCNFVGPLTGHPKTIGTRLFNRSCVVTFRGCMWNMFTRGIEAQSFDRVFLDNCRIQVGNEVFDSDVERPNNEAQVVLRHGRLRVNGFVGNPPLVEASDADLKTWQAYESLVKGAYREIDGTAYRTKRDYVCTEDTALEDLTPGSLDWETIPAEAASIPNIDWQRYFWFKVQDFDYWEANAEYVKGDVIRQPYADGGNDVYWVRLAYTADSGATWAADRDNWLPIDCMRDFDPDVVVNQYDVRRCKDPADLKWKFYVSNSTRTTGSSFDAAEKNNWTLVTNSYSTATGYGQGTWVGYRNAGQPISGWHTIDILGQTLLGAETGGLTPLYWAVDRMPVYSNIEEKRKQTTSFYIVGNSLQTDRRFPHLELNQTNDYTSGAIVRPCVLLAGVPNYGVIRDNTFGTVLHSVAACWDPASVKKPLLPCNGPDNVYSKWAFDIRGNHQGSAGHNSFTPVTHTPYASTYYLYSPNWAPEELLVPSFPPMLVTAGDLSGVTAWATGVVVRNGEIRKATDPDDSIEKMFRSRYHRTTGASFGADEKKYWEIVEDEIVSANTYVSPFVGSATLYKADMPLTTKISTFTGATHGHVFSVYFPTNKCVLEHAVGRMRLKGATAVNPVPGASWMTFTVVNGEVWEIARSF